MTRKWEYRVLNMETLVGYEFSDNDEIYLDVLQEKITDLGHQGWELVDISGEILFFKRADNGCKCP